MPYKDPESQRAWYRANREKRIAYMRQWRTENPDAKRENYAKNREKALADAAEYKRQHRAYYSDLESTRNAKKRKQFIEHVDRDVLYTMHGGMCGICKGFIEGEFHVDHVIPVSKGGMHGYINTQPAHPVCNMSKGNRV